MSNMFNALQDSLMLLMLPALGEVKPPEGDDEQKAAFLGLRERPNAKRDGGNQTIMFLKWILKFSLTNVAN